MKSMLRSLVVMLMMVPVISFAQTGKATPWPELKTFHKFMSGSFHPTEEGNFKPLKENADSMLIAAKAWQASPIPADYKENETKAELKKLVVQCMNISEAVKAGAGDERLQKLISAAHDIFHKIVGECKKGD